MQPQVAPSERSVLRSVAIPTEHGGWGLTCEPALVGLWVRPSVAGLCLGLAAVAAFVAKTPLRVVMVDRRRVRHLRRTTVAVRLLLVEVAVIAVLLGAAFATASNRLFWLPALAAAPLVGIELWFDSRSKSRRLAPELAGAIGVGAVAPMIVLASAAEVTGGIGGSAPADLRLALALWMIIAARVVASIPFVRAQIARIRGASEARPAGGEGPAAGITTLPLWATDLAATALAFAATAADLAVMAGAIAIVMLVALQRLSSLGEPQRAAIIGAQQMMLGFFVVAATAIGARLA